MRASVVPKIRGLSETAEHQMRMWAMRMESEQRPEEKQAAVVPEQLIQPYIAVSRETGVDAGQIAELVAEKNGWKVFDRELLDYMAEHYHWSRVALDYVDERTASWFHETFGKWLDERLVSQAEYVSRLGQIVLLAAQHEKTVFVGRSAQFILPRELGLTVRLIGPRKQRVQRIAERRQCTAAEAERFIDETDRGRADFVKRYFHRDVADPNLYDLVLNLEHLTRGDAAELIVTAYRLTIEQKGAG